MEWLGRRAAVEGVDMAMVMTEGYGRIHLPSWVTTVKRFWRWREAADLPEKLPVHLIRGELWADTSAEEMFSHNRIRTALGLALGGLIESGELGVYVPDGMTLSNSDADLVTEPDAMFLSTASLQTKRVWFEAGKRRGRRPRGWSAPRTWWSRSSARRRRIRTWNG
ncbi:MAG TPA: hypothetical protein VH092_26315 [Urbifossiella sp.]|nr:hypothetical protein [Urbifossiella sp.]